jgi:hypothetical protein
MARQTARLEDIARFDPRADRKLGRAVSELLASDSELMFLSLISPMIRGGKGKQYKNFSENLPMGTYKELEVAGSQDSRRIVYDTQTFDIFATPNHYDTMYYAGKPAFADSRY